MSKPKTWCYICLSFPHFYLSQILIPRTHIQYQSPFPHVYFQPESSLWTPKRHPNTFLISLPVWPISVSRSHYSELFTWSQTCSKPHYSLIQLLRPKRFASSLTFIKKNNYYLLYLEKTSRILSPLSIPAANLHTCSVVSDSLIPYGISQARILTWVAISSSRRPSWRRESNPSLLHCRRTLYHWASGEAPPPTTAVP